MIDIYTIHCINIDSLDTQDILSKLHNIGFQETFLNGISFCPYLIIHKDFDDNKTLVYENINVGFLNRIKSQCIVIEHSTIEDFINAAKHLAFNKENKNSLF